MKFYYIYKALAHPEHNGYVAPFTQEERLLHVAEAKRTLGSRIPWICDTIDNKLKHALGNAPNSEFVIDSSGEIVIRRQWSSPNQLRTDLTELVGAVDDPTTVADLKLKVQPPPKVAAKGVVKRIPLPSGLSPLRIESQEADQPYYVKLRAEAEANLTRGGEGKLYLGFHLDPIYHVHWNNLAAPVKFEIVDDGGAELTPGKGEGPKVSEAADIDPREFLVDVKLGEAKQLRIRVDYFACNDEEGWCKPVTQEYIVHFEVDRDGGRARRSGSRGGGSGRRPGGGGGVQANVVSVDLENGRITVENQEGKETTYRLLLNVQAFNADRQQLRLEDIEKGDRVMLGIFSRRGKEIVGRIMVRQ